MNNPLITKKVATISIITLLIAALGLFIWAVVTQRFELRRKAATGEPTTPPIVEPSDDLRFSTGYTAITFTTTDQTPNVSIDPNKLVSGKTYLLNLTYQIQNDYKTQDATSAGIPVILLANNNFLSAKDMPYSLIAGHADGAGDNQSATFVAGATNTIELQIDPNNIFGETNETNNKLTLTFPQGSSPAPTASSSPASCTRGIQSVSLEPSTKSGYRGQSITYTVTVRNNDDRNCDKANFTLSAILPYSNWSASFAQSVLSIAPQTTASTTVNFKSSSNSPFGTLPVGVNTVGPRAALVAAANYQVLQGTPAPNATPEVVYVNNGLGSSPSATATLVPVSTDEASVMNATLENETPGGVLSSIPTAVIYAIGGFLLIVLFFILRALFGGNKNNPPKMTPPTTSTGPSNSMNQTPQISHSVEAPLNQ